MSSITTAPSIFFSSNTRNEPTARELYLAELEKEYKTDSAKLTARYIGLADNIADKRISDGFVSMMNACINYPKTMNFEKRLHYQTILENGLNSLHNAALGSKPYWRDERPIKEASQFLADMAEVYVKITNEERLWEPITPGSSNLGRMGRIMEYASIGLDHLIHDPSTSNGNNLPVALRTPIDWKSLRHDANNAVNAIKWAKVYCSEHKKYIWMNTEEGFRGLKNEDKLEMLSKNEELGVLLRM